MIFHHVDIVFVSARARRNFAAQSAKANLAFRKCIGYGSELQHEDEDKCGR